MRIFSCRPDQVANSMAALVESLRTDPTMIHGGRRITSLFDPKGASIGNTVTDYPGLMIVIHGEAWARGSDGITHKLQEGQGAIWDAGEWYSYGPCTHEFKALDLTAATLDAELQLRHFEDSWIDPGNPKDDLS